MPNKYFIEKNSLTKLTAVEYFMAVFCRGVNIQMSRFVALNKVVVAMHKCERPRQVVILDKS